MSTSPQLKATPPLTLLKTLEARQLGVAWIVAVLLGMLVISKSGSTNPKHLVWPLLILLLYGIYAWNRWATLFGETTEAFKQSIIGQLADSIYFMGFVWTLWALIDSFVLRQKLGTADEMFHAFGYALSTTAAGMFGRLAILQFKYTAADQSQEAQETVEQLLKKFGETLRQSEMTLAAWRTQLEVGTQAIDSCNKELQTVLVGIKTETDESVKQAIDSLREGLKNAVFRIDTVIKTLEEQLQTSIKQGVADGLSDLRSQTAAHLHEIREATSTLTAALTKGAFDISGASASLAVNIKDMEAALQAATNRIETLDTAFAHVISQAAAAVEGAASRFASEMAPIPESVRSECETAAYALTQIAEQVDEDVKEKLAAIDPSALTADRISEGMVKAVKPATELLDTIGLTVRGIQRVVGAPRDGERASIISEVRDRLPLQMEGGITKIDSRLESIEGRISAALTNSNANQKKRSIFGWFWNGR